MNGNDLRASGRLPAESESAGYLPHKYSHEYLDPVTKKPVPGLAGGEGFLQKRFYDNIVDAELSGLAPVKNLAGLVADYHENAGYVLAKDAFSEALASGRTNEGAPMAAPQGLRRGGVLGAHDALVDDAELENLQKSGALETLMQSGRIYDRPNESGEPELMWRQTDFEPSGAPYTVTGLNVWRDGQRVPLALNPEVAPHAQGLLEQANPSRLAQFALKLSGGAKSAILSLSPFHWATMTNRMFELLKNPFQRPTIDFLNPSPELQAGLRDGLMLGGRGMGRAAEGIVPSKESFVNKIPLVGGLNKLIEENLFGSSGYISGLKVEAYATLKREIQKSRPGMSDVQAGRIAASQVNNKFGGLNYDVLGRGANTQNALRLMMLAPTSWNHGTLDSGPRGRLRDAAAQTLCRFPSGTLFYGARGELSDVGRHPPRGGIRCALEGWQTRIFAAHNSRGLPALRRKAAGLYGESRGSVGPRRGRGLRPRGSARP